jgi:large subunit ribosomal protein L21
VIVSGGKQYRVSPGDRILVDRLAAEPGSSFKIGRLLLFSGEDGVKVGSAELEGLDVDARVIAHRRGPRIESIRYKSKKRVRVHRGGRADLTALEIIAVGGVGLETAEKEEEETKPATRRGRAKAAPKKKKAETKSEAKAETKAEAEGDEKAADEAPKKATRKRASKKETE